MREIKFRAWDIEDKKFIYGTTIMQENGIWFMQVGDYIDIWHEVEFVTQYTGFKDKNGVEIYEGDIIDTRYAKNHKPRCFEIIYLNGAFVVDEPFSNHTLDVYMLDKIPVVGNIYENSELLKV